MACSRVHEDMTSPTDDSVSVATLGPSPAVTLDEKNSNSLIGGAGPVRLPGRIPRFRLLVSA